MSSEHWAGLPFLDALRPEPGENVEVAILTTYSLDLVALVAAMLALAGLDDDRGSGSKVDFANAFEKTRNKLRVLVQAGRIAWPKDIPGLMGIMDRFVYEIQQDETQGSWHPKIALLKFRSTETSITKWRLWIGSRNLSRGMRWETGLLLIGSANETGQKIPGLVNLGSELAARARLEGWDAGRIAQELEQVTWKVPSGAYVDNIHLFLPGRSRTYPPAPTGIKKLIVISPFLDGKTLEHFGSWGDEQTERYLLGTIPELAKIKGLASKALLPFSSHLLTLDAPNGNEMFEPVNLPAQTENPPIEELITHDLHAKLIYVEHTQGYTLWLGSANTTRRGWMGPNSEVIARLQVDQTISKGLWSFLYTARPVSLSDLPDPPKDDDIEERLELARKQVVNQWAVKQVRQANGVKLVSENPPHPLDLDIKMEVGLITGTCVTWPRNNAYLDLPVESKARETSLVLVRLSLKGVQASWVQLAPLDPPPDEDRDNRALAAHLSPRVFLLWLRSMLSAGEILDGGGEWHIHSNDYKTNSANTLTWWAPTLEEVLSSWTRQPENIKLVDQKVQTYLRLIREQSQMEYSPDDERLLKQFEKTWQVIRITLIEGNHE